METVYNGQGDKLSMRLFAGDSLASEIFYNGSFTYESEGGGLMKLRDMTNPEGVVVKSNGKYDYRYFMRDYLGNVRYVSGILQYTDYDPLGKIIYSSNLNKNVYLYEGKERIPDLSKDYESVYDFGARYYNPLYGRWFAPDPEKQGINPYVYCGNNPIMLVDPNGQWFIDNGLLDDFKIFRNGTIERIKTNAKTDSFFVETDSGEFEKVGELNKHKTNDGVTLVDFPDSGDGFTRYGPKDVGGDHSVQPLVAAALYGAVYDARAQDPTITLQFGDMSATSGAKPGTEHIGGAMSHVNGRNVDVRYTRTDRKLDPVQVDHKEFDYDASQITVNSFYKFGFKDIKSDHSIKPVLENTNHYRGHNNHMHLQKFTPIVIYR